MSTSRPLLRSLTELPDLIQGKYKTGNEMVTAKFREELRTAVIHYFERLPVSVRERQATTLRRVLLELQSVQKITSRDLHMRLYQLTRKIEDDESAPSSEPSVIRLERQLQDLRQMVSAPSDVERKIRDLQDQVQSLRSNDDTVALTEKQEDMLQRFIKSDKRAFIIMPFAREFDNVWFGSIKPACTELRYAPLRVDEVNLSSLITEDIEKYSTMANVVVVDLTGNNPNVMFEFGWALAKSKKPIVICQGDHSSKVSFDVRGIRHISYENTWLGVEALKAKLKHFISGTETNGVKSKSSKKLRSNDTEI